MTTTPKYVFPVPNPTDLADGPNQILALAMAIETLLSTGTVDMTAGTVRVKTPVVAADASTKGYIDGRLLIGTVGTAPSTAPDGTIFFGY